ncbi:MAG: hypothetical protein AAF721_04760 [Myxococcota bacterium]
MGPPGGSLGPLGLDGALGFGLGPLPGIGLPGNGLGVGLGLWVVVVVGSFEVGSDGPFFDVVGLFFGLGAPETEVVVPAASNKTLAVTTKERRAGRSETMGEVGSTAEGRSVPDFPQNPVERRIRGDDGPQEPTPIARALATSPLPGTTENVGYFFHPAEYRRVEGTCGAYVSMRGAMQFASPRIEGTHRWLRAELRVSEDESRATLRTASVDLTPWPGTPPHVFEVEFDPNSLRTRANLLDAHGSELGAWHQVIPGE